MFLFYTRRTHARKHARSNKRSITISLRGGREKGFQNFSLVTNLQKKNQKNEQKISRFSLFLESLVFVLSVVRLLALPSAPTAAAVISASSAAAASPSLQRALRELVPGKVHRPERGDPHRSRGRATPERQDALVAQDRRQSYKGFFSVLI